MCNDQIICPVCGHVFDEECSRDHYTYHGDDDPKRDTCEDCQAELLVDETVIRMFEVTVVEPVKLPYPEVEGITLPIFQSMMCDELATQIITDKQTANQAARDAAKGETT